MGVPWPDDSLRDGSRPFWDWRCSAPEWAAGPAVRFGSRQPPHCAMSARPVLIVVEEDSYHEESSIDWGGLAGRRHLDVLLLHVENRVFPVPCLGETGGALMIPGPPPEIAGSWEHERRVEAWRRLAAVHAQLPEVWAVHRRLECGETVETTCRVASEQRVARILLLHGRRGWWRGWLGHWMARRIADRSLLPVHIVGREGKPAPQGRRPRSGVRSVFPRSSSPPNPSPR